MQELQNSIRQLRTENHQGRYFFPQQSLYSLVTPDVVRKVLKECKVAHHHTQEIVDAVVPGARKIFAILVVNNEVNCITRFIEQDQLQQAVLDQQLPFTRAELEVLLHGVHTIKIDDFYEKQWEFTAPVFSEKLIPRRLDSRTIMPFIEEDRIAKGGFGVVYKIKIHDEHCKFKQIPTREASYLNLVRKEFEVFEANSELELENLAMLKSLKNPNIVDILGSYVHGSKLNLIFPRASGGDLADLLKLQNRPTHFASNESFLVALSELSSAICAVHNFAADNPELAKHGIHHDIKTRNILVDGGRLILADFGHSRFKTLEQPSETAYKINEGYYIAPECCDIVDPFSKHTVRRSSDIWSFGCIIAEVLTYMMKGPEGVAEFMAKRWFKAGQWTLCSFHCGKTPNPGVTDWLSHLDLEASRSSSNVDSRSCKMLLQLVRKMLHMDPELRLNAFQVEASLYFIALDFKARKIADLYTSARNLYSESIDAGIEEKRFQSWRWALGMIDTNGSVSSPHQTDIDILSGSFLHAVNYLNDIENRLDDIVSWEQWPRWKTFLPLQRFNESLLDQLPQDIKNEAHSYLLSESEDAAQIEKIHHDRWPINQRLTGITRKNIPTKDRLGLSQAELDRKLSIDIDSPHQKTSARMVVGASEKKQPVVLIWKHLDKLENEHKSRSFDDFSNVFVSLK